VPLNYDLSSLRTEKHQKQGTKKKKGNKKNARETEKGNFVDLFEKGFRHGRLKKKSKRSRQVSGWVWDLANARGSVGFLLPTPRSLGAAKNDQRTPPYIC
jgi:hypothetical protein